MTFDIFYLDDGLKQTDISNLSSIKHFPLWIDVTGITKDETHILEKEFDLHALTTEDLYTNNIRIKIEEFNKYLFSVFYGIDNTKTLHSYEMDFVLGKNFLITNHKKPLKNFDNFKNAPERIERNLNKGSDFLFHRLLDMEIDSFLPLIDMFDDSISDIESQATSNPSRNTVNKILKIKHDLKVIKKIASPQREKISFLAKNDYDLISKKASVYFRDVYDHSVRIAEGIENQKEGISTAFDIYMSTVSNNMNEVMKVLSIIATIALPLTVVSGIYGTNFTNLPGSTFSFGFWLMIIAMVLMVIGMLFYFKIRKWF